MKLEYFLSPTLSISERLMDNYKIDRQNHWSAEKATNWRQTEKTQRIKEISEKIEENILDKQIKNLATSKGNILKAVMKLSELVAKDIIEKWNVRTLKNSSDIERVWKIIKTELNEPTQVSRNEHTGKDWEVLFDRIIVQIDEWETNRKDQDTWADTK